MAGLCSKESQLSSLTLVQIVPYNLSVPSPGFAGCVPGHVLSRNADRAAIAPKVMALVELLEEKGAVTELRTRLSVLSQPRQTFAGDLVQHLRWDDDSPPDTSDLEGTHLDVTP